jgi:hypothetical protein
MNNINYKTKYLKYKKKFNHLNELHAGAEVGIYSTSIPNLNVTKLNKIETPRVPKKFELSSEDNVDYFLSNRLNNFLNTNLKIKVNQKIEKIILDLFEENPKLRITISDILFMNIDDLSQKYINLILEINKHQGGALGVGIHNNFRDGGLYLMDPGYNTFRDPNLLLSDPGYIRQFGQLRIPYKYITKSEFKNCNNNFNFCPQDTLHPDSCINYSELENKNKLEDCIQGTKCSPEDIISYEIFANSNSKNFFQFDQTKTCYDGENLNKSLQYNHTNPETRDIYYQKDKAAVYMDTLIKQEISNHYLQNRFNLLVRNIYKYPVKSMGITFTGQMLLKTVHDLIVYGKLLEITPLFATVPLSKTKSIISVLGLASIIGVAYYTKNGFRTDELENIIPVKTYRFIFQKLYNYKDTSYLDSLPDVPEGRVLDLFLDSLPDVP